MLMWWQLYALRSDVSKATGLARSTLDVVEAVRISVAGSLVEKARLAKSGYNAAVEGVKIMFLFKQFPSSPIWPRP